jgi:hypothetical protein
MNKTWSDVDHVGKITISILDSLTKEYNLELEQDNPDLTLLVKLASAVGYQAQLYSSLYKNHEISKRIDYLEKQMKGLGAQDMAMLYNPVVIAEDDERNRLEGR